jgi:hypothetical protein
VGSNPTRSIFINLVNYGIKLSLFWEVVGQNQQQPTITSSASTAAQIPIVTSSLEQKLDHLIAEVQALRMELQKRK